jgi:hypothetical protein
MDSFSNGPNLDWVFSFGDILRNTFMHPFLRTWKISGRISSSFDTVDANLLRDVREISVQHFAFCLEMDQERFERLL